jgi:hypothetical protein
MKAYWGVEVELHAFLTSALDGGDWSASRPGHFTRRERTSGTHWIEAGLVAGVKRKFPALTGIRTPDHPTRSPALHH